MKNGLQFQNAYTWAKTIDNGQGGRNDCTASSAVGSNPYNPRFDRSKSCFSANHTWVSNFIYKFPSVKKQSQLIKSVANGWGVMGIYSAHTGFPFNVWETTERAAPDITPAARFLRSIAPIGILAFTGPVILGGPTKYYDPNAFILQPVGTLGNVGRNSLTGPGYSQLDFALQKNMKVPLMGETGAVEFRTEFFNILNHPNFGSPNSAVFTGALANVTETPISSAGQITSTMGTSRQIELH